MPSQPTTQLPPGYTWGHPATGDHAISRQYVILDPTGRQAGDVNNVQALWDRYNAATGGDATSGGGMGLQYGTPLTLQQLGAIGTAQEGQRLSDEGQLSALEKEYEGIPDRLRELYTNAAQRGGTYAQTNEFRVGMQGEVNQGTRGAQAALGTRMAALYEQLGRPVPANIAQYTQKAPDVNGVGSNAETNLVGDNDNTSSYQQQTRPVTGQLSSADQQNAVAKTSDPEKARLAAIKAAAAANEQ